MNIFYLSRDPELCVRYHCDKHTVKMILEHVQMLSTANRLSGLDEGYKPTHKNHPCSVWVRQSRDNWLYLFELTRLLNAEFKYRFGHTKNHKSFDMALTLTLPDLPRVGVTVPPKCMPDDAKQSTVVASYQNYYRLYKTHILTYTGRPIPKFLRDL